MAIATHDDVVAGLRAIENFLKNGATTVAGRYFSMAYQGGQPGAIAVPSAGVNGEALTTLAGQIPFTNPGGADYSYLGRFAGYASQPGQLVLVDRLWQNSGLSATLTSSQAITPVALPARDRDGTTNGKDVMAGIEVSGALGAGTPTITTGYTNSGGTAARSSISAAIGASSPAGSFYPLPLQAGDEGVRSVESIQLSASMVSGTYHLVLYRVLAQVPILAAGLGEVQDYLRTGLPRLYDNTVPMLLYFPAGTTAPLVSGQMQVVQG